MHTIHKWFFCPWIDMNMSARIAYTLIYTTRKPSPQNPHTHTHPRTDHHSACAASNRPAIRNSHMYMVWWTTVRIDAQHHPFRYPYSHCFGSQQRYTSLYGHIVIHVHMCVCIDMRCQISISSSYARRVCVWPQHNFLISHSPIPILAWAAARSTASHAKDGDRYGNATQCQWCLPQSIRLLRPQGLEKYCIIPIALPAPHIEYGKHAVDIILAYSPRYHRIRWGLGCVSVSICVRRTALDRNEWRACRKRGY